jgi:hypothetical protein
MSTSNGHMPHAAATSSTRIEPGERWDVAGAIVTTLHVQLARGWRHEVSVEHDAIDPPSRAPAPAGEVGRIVDPGGPVRRRDTLWLADALDAQRLARAAVDELRRRAFDGLSQLARRLKIDTPEHA